MARTSNPAVANSSPNRDRHFRTLAWPEDDVSVPELPSDVEPEGGWHPRAVLAWDLLWCSPMRGEFLPCDEVAMVVFLRQYHDYWDGEPSSRKAMELRTLMKDFGVTPESRRALKIQVARREPDRQPVPVPDEVGERRGRVKRRPA